MKKNALVKLKKVVKSHLKKDMREEKGEIADDKSLIKKLGGYAKQRIKRPTTVRRAARSR
jgi:hypothetical protein